MRDLFDEFMDELRRRQAGEEPPAKPAAEGDGDRRGRRRPRPGARRRARGRARRRGRAGRSTMPTAPASGRDRSRRTRAPDRERPRPIAGGRGGRAGGGGGGGGRRRTRIGGPNDGASFRDQLGTLGRRLGLIALAIFVLFFIALAASGIDLATDNVWYQSVGYGNVFWTRLTAQVGLFFLVLIGAALFLLGNLWVPRGSSRRPIRAARAACGHGSSNSSRVRPPVQPATTAAPSVATAADRSVAAPPAAVPAVAARGRPATGPSVAAAWAAELRDRDRAARSDPGGGLGRGRLRGLLVSFALATSLAGRWETVLLWQNRVPFGLDAAAPVTDPVFHRDIGYFLFELPFLRLAQSVVNGAAADAALIIALARYLVAGLRSGVRVHDAGAGPPRPCSPACTSSRSRPATSSTSSSSSTARRASRRRQLHRRHARFLAFDVLTVIRRWPARSWSAARSRG